MTKDGHYDIDLTSDDSFSEMISVQRWRPSDVRERTRRHVAIALVALHGISNLLVLGLVGVLTFSALESTRVEVARQLLVGAGAYFGGSTAMLAVVLRYYFKRS